MKSKGIGSEQILRGDKQGNRLRGHAERPFTAISFQLHEATSAIVSFGVCSV